MSIKILFIGDIVGRPGRESCKKWLPGMIHEWTPDLVIANGENAASGKGITHDVTGELLAAGIDVLTMGNHVWDNREIFNFIDQEHRIVRPANYPEPCPGVGSRIYTANNGYRVGVISLAGRVFMPAIDCPFKAVDLLIDQMQGRCETVFVDFHAEATSEKIAFGYYVDGRVGAVVGTHTHVQTADERILPGGTGYITDVGMTGPLDGVIGVAREQVIEKFITGRPTRFEVMRKGSTQINAIYLELDQKSRQCTRIYRIQQTSPQI
ncbi:MAG: TIGR00282 family metallophosphoesterase [Methylocystaceae bacterium]